MMFPFKRGKGGGKRILVVDDDNDLLQMLRVLLEGAGYETFTTVDGHAGLQMAIDKSPDLIILDMMIPVLSGTYIAKAIRTHPKTERIPILMCTAKNKLGDVEEGLAAGANDYISKPFDLPRFLAKVGKILKQH